MRRRSWIVGGSLLLASALLSAVSGAAGFPVPAVSFVGALAFTAATVVFAFGIPDGGRVIGPSPRGSVAPGTIALLMFGFWPLATAISWSIPVNYSPAMPLFSVLAYVEIVVPLAAGIIAVVSIARAGTIPAPWNWAPAWALGAMILPSLVVEFLAVATPTELQALTPGLTVFGLLVAVGVPGFLGVLALLLAPRTGLAPRTERVDRAVPVYPPDAGATA